MRHARQSDKGFEVFGNELRAVVRYYSRSGIGELFASSLNNCLDIFLGHRLTDFPVNQEATVAIENGAEIVESPADIEIRNVRMPMLMGLRWLRKTGSFLGRLSIPTVQQLCVPQHTIGRRGAYGYDIVI